jgi:hypothetical protein
MNDDINKIMSIVSSYNYASNNEKELQLLIYNSLIKHNINVEREYNLAPYGNIDFFYNGIGFELKIKGQKKAIYRQCRDYCEHEDIKSLVLLTVATSMGLPEEINNKKCYVFSINRGF